MLKKGVKIILAVGLVGLVGLGLALLGKGGTVKKSQADIVDFRFGFESKTEKFVNTLDRMGHSPPQVYELNGNRIYFSRRTADKSPKELLTDYQEELVDQGLNDQVFDSFDDSETMQRIRTGLTGGVVPVEIRDDYVAMNGILPSSGADSTEELLKNYDPTKTVSELFNGYRWIEAFNSPGRKESTVLAMWSDSKFEFAKMRVPKADLTDMNLHKAVPVCPGCEQVNQFSDKNIDGLHETYIFETRRSITGVRRFYTSRLKAQGWELSVNSKIMDRVRRHIDVQAGGSRRLKFTSDDKQMVVEIFPHEERKTAVRISLVDETYLKEKHLDKVDSAQDNHILSQFER